MSGFEHGTPAGYTHRKCRCVACTKAASLARKEWRLRVLEHGGPMLIDSTGTLRRLQALAVMGWPVRVVAEKAGLRPGPLAMFFYSPGARINVARAEAVADAYEVLCMRPGPSKATGTIARRRGYAPPLAWNDIDDPADRPRGVLAA